MILVRYLTKFLAVVGFVAADLNWIHLVPKKRVEIPETAIFGGNDRYLQNVFVGRLNHSIQGWIAATIVVEKRGAVLCFTSYNTQEFKVSYEKCQVATETHPNEFKWVPSASKKSIDCEKAVTQPGFGIGRAFMDHGDPSIGKIYQKLGLMSAPYYNKEYNMSHYEVLIKSC